jgi:hypothetical protein
MAILEARATRVMTDMEWEKKKGWLLRMLKDGMRLSHSSSRAG